MASDHLTDDVTITPDNLKNIKLWYASFVPLFIATIIFVICFLLEYYLFLYVILFVVFTIFVVLFSYASKKITHKDGYTLVQAMSFYKECKKANINLLTLDEEQSAKIYELATHYEYSKELTKDQLYVLYKTGKGLTEAFEK